MRRAYDPHNPALLRSETLLGSLEAAAELGIDLSASLVRSGIAAEQLGSPKGFLAFHKVINFLDDVATRFDCPQFGFLVGKHQAPLRFGVLGRFLRLAPNLGSAFTAGVDYSWVTSQESLWHLRREGGLAHLTRHSRISYDGPVEQLHTLSITVLFKALMVLSGGNVRPSYVSFAHAETRTSEIYRRFFKSPVYFDMDSDAIVLPEQCLKQPIETADPELFPIVRSHLDSMRAAHSPDDHVTAKVYHHISKSLGTTFCNLESVAQLLDQHPRALQRELNRVGVSFRQLLLDVRQEQAERYLRASNISLTQLADFLGYRNVSAFSRAFKGNCGLSPAEWRHRHRS
jgi:AraC-like DNA-binding protein